MLSGQALGQQTQGVSSWRGEFSNREAVDLIGCQGFPPWVDDHYHTIMRS